tara:strand:- start:10 stop:945 length:936 start_codon:yes stop_codon:yes gene_type:complete
MLNNILVTGGAGFLGSHLCNELLKLNFNVTCLDNLFTGKIENIKNNLNNPKFKFIEHDVTVFKKIRCNYIFHLACPASPVHYQKDPVKTISTNVAGTLNILELAKSNKSPVLFTSTSEVYGDPEMTPQKEDYWGRVNPIGVRSCYDEGKRCAETLCFDFHRQYNLEIKVVRIFNTYGPKMSVNDGRVVSNFIIQALKNFPITVYGNGKHTRSLCYVSDLIGGLIKVSKLNKNFTGPINLGQDHEITIIELAKKIIKLTKSKSKIVFHKLPENDPKQRNPDLQFAINSIKWEPKINLDNGLKKTIKYFKELI